MEIILAWTNSLNLGILSLIHCIAYSQRIIRKQKINLVDFLFK